MVRNLAKRAMTTKGQKACYIIDHLVEALAGDPSSSLRRALILTDIDQYPNATQTGIMERVSIHKSALNREIEWLFNYGCIRRGQSEQDAREVPLGVCGYSKRAMDDALDYFNGEHENLKIFLNGMIKTLKMDKPTLRDAKIAAFICEKGQATRQEVMDSLRTKGSSTDHRALRSFVSNGMIEESDAYA